MKPISEREIEMVCKLLCASGIRETGEGTCSLVCLDQLGEARKRPCSHRQEVFRALAIKSLNNLEKYK